ncbi:hypothetical protein ABK040_002761 [Willaertia magna]
MGNNTTSSSEVNFESANDDLNIIEFLPLTELETEPIIKLCYHFHYDNVRIIIAMKKTKLSGNVFKNYSKAYFQYYNTDADDTGISLKVEREVLLKRLMVTLDINDTIELDRLITEVIDAKLKIEGSVGRRSVWNSRLTNNSSTN